MFILWVHTLLKVVSRYHLNVLSISVMGFQKSLDSVLSSILFSRDLKKKNLTYQSPKMKGRKRHTHVVHDDGHDLAHLGSVVQFLAALPSSPGRREQHLQTARHTSIRCCPKCMSTTLLTFSEPPVFF